MPYGYYLPYIADSDQPYWQYPDGQLPNPKKNPAGTIPKGSHLFLQRPPDTLGTHQSAYLYGVGRILVKIGGFRPAPASPTTC
jgi:hypothetical protein